MKFHLMAVKAILSIVAGAYFFISDGILGALFMSGIVYGLISFYIWYFKMTGFSFSVWWGNKGCMLTLISLALKIIAPIIILDVIIFICKTIFPPKIGMTIGGLIITIICLVFLISDIREIIKYFRKK